MSANAPTVMTAEALSVAVAEMRSLTDHAVSVSEKSDKALSAAVKPAMLKVAQAVGSDRNTLADEFFMGYYRRRLLATDKATIGRQWNASRTLADYHLKQAGLSCAWRKITNGDGETAIRSLDAAKEAKAEASAKKQADLLDAQSRLAAESLSTLRAKDPDAVASEIVGLLRMWSEDPESQSRAMRAASVTLFGEPNSADADTDAMRTRAEADRKTIMGLQDQISTLHANLSHAQNMLELARAENQALTAPPVTSGKNGSQRLHYRAN